MTSGVRCGHESRIRRVLSAGGYPDGLMAGNRSACSATIAWDWRRTKAQVSGDTRWTSVSYAVVTERLRSVRARLSYMVMVTMLAITTSNSSVAIASTIIRRC